MTIDVPACPTAEDPFLGGDGLATLLLALLVAGGSLGLTLGLAGWRVLRVARRAPAALPAGSAGWAVVLGSALRAGRPDAAFAARLARARRLAEDDPALSIAVLGGVTAPGAPAEAEVGLAWLRAAGLPAGRLVAETRSRHTLENLREFRARVAPGRSATGAVLLVTSRSHLARAVLMAEGLGLVVLPVAAEPAAPTPLPAREWRRLPAEAFLLHWYLVGRGFARLTRNRRMLRRIT